jgi:hypothetical protein
MLTAVKITENVQINTNLLAKISENTHESRNLRAKTGNIHESGSFLTHETWLK